MTTRCRPLVDVLAEVPDFRSHQGQRHPLTAVLALACAAMLCGYRSYGAIAEWGRNYGQRLVRALGFTHEPPPCAATLHTIFRHLDRDALEAQLGAWAANVLDTTPPPNGAEEGIALDGKTLRGSRKQGVPGAHLLSAVSHRLGLTLAQRAVPDQTNEIPIVLKVLQDLVMHGRVFTMDALLTQRKVAQTILDGEGDYVMFVKENQPQLLADIQQVFQAPKVLGDTMTAATTWDPGHGRIERRRLTTSAALRGYSDWPGLQQVFHLERRITNKKTSHQRITVVYGVTSLTPERAGPQQLLQLTRQHWHIENKAHWVRDVTFDEDRSQVRCGSTPQVMAALRNTAIGLMRCAGATNIAATCRYFAAQPWSALALIGIKPEN